MEDAEKGTHVSAKTSTGLNVTMNDYAVIAWHLYDGVALGATLTKSGKLLVQRHHLREGTVEALFTMGVGDE